jgi:histidinol dehydrogenase
MNQSLTLLTWAQLTESQRSAVLQRPISSQSASLQSTVAEIIQQVQQQGDRALKIFSERFDKQVPDCLAVSNAQISSASVRIPTNLVEAMQRAANNIQQFHQAQQFQAIDLETEPGVRCQQLVRPMESVGLYIPGGSAPLFSTVLMLAIPARLAGCQRIVLCSPPPIADEILFAAQLCGVSEVYQVGGAQALAALAFGTETIPPVAKIFGPGNAWVTEAKRQVSQHPTGAAIDMPAGPSELLVIADAEANPDFVASDLLSQAEHGPDSQVLLVSPSASLVAAVAAAIPQQLATLPRAAIARQALASSRLIIAEDIASCVAISNRYGPEHLSIQTRDPRSLLPAIQHAGSVFLGPWSPESAGDYASGTNHVLPTNSYTKTYSSLGLADFQKRLTVQELSQAGFQQLAASIETLAAAEQLDAHRQAVSIRLQKIRDAE